MSTFALYYSYDLFSKIFTIFFLAGVFLVCGYLCNSLLTPPENVETYQKPRNNSYSKPNNDNNVNYNWDDTWDDKWLHQGEYADDDK